MERTLTVARLLAVPLALLSAAPAPATDAVHPAYDLVTVRPPGYEPRVAGLDFLPGGRLAIATWQPNEIHVLEGADGPPGKGTVRKVADGFSEVMGLTVSGDTLYAVDQERMYRLTDENRDGVPETKAVIGKIPYSGSFHEWSFGLVRKDGRLYTSLSVANTRTGRTSVPQKEPLRGTIVAMDDQGKLEVIASGLRAAEGLCLGPEGEIFATDNQGSWLPASKLIHVQKGKTYGHRTEPPGRFDGQVPTLPALWLPYGEPTKSPTQPVMAVAGPYAGQIFYGDIASGAVKRVFLEKVEGVWQGGVTRFSEGFEAAVHRMIAGKDGSFWLGGLGNGDQHNWGWMGRRFGLQRLKPNGKGVFEVKAARIRSGGIEVELTEKAGPRALEPDAWQARRWWYEPTSGYGGPKKDVAEVRIDAVKASRDGKRLFLQVEGMKLHHVLHVRLKDVRSESGKAPWTPEFWYTVNAFSSARFAP